MPGTDWAAPSLATPERCPALSCCDGVPDEMTIGSSVCAGTFAGVGVGAGAFVADCRRATSSSARQDGATLWAHASGALKAPLPLDPLPTDPEPTPAAQADYDCRVLARDVWDSRDAATALALSELLPPTEAVHFAQVDTAHGIWDAVVARYSTPSSASLSRLLMPFVFPDLGLFFTVFDLVTHLHSLDAGFRAACTDAQLLVAPPPMWLTVHWLVTRFPGHLATARDVLLHKHPTELTIDLLETTLGKIESNLLSVASASDAVPPPLSFPLSLLPTLLLLCQLLRTLLPSLPLTGRNGARVATRAGREVEEAAVVAVELGAVVVAEVAVVPQEEGALEEVQDRQARLQTMFRPQQQQPQQHQPHPCVCGRDDHSIARCFRRLDDLYRARWGPEVTTPCWARLLARNILVFDLSMDDARQYALYVDVDYSADGFVCSRVGRLACLPPASVDLCLSSLGASVSALGACVASTPGSPQAVASLSFTLDFGASQCFFRDHTTLTPLLAPVLVAVADPSLGPAVARSSTTLPCPVVPSGVLRGLHIPSFTHNLVGVGYLQDRGITVTFVGGGRTALCTDAVTGRVLATFTREPRSGLYVLHTENSPVSTSPQVVASPQVPVPPPVVASGQVAACCLCRSFTHRTLLWHHRLGHSSIPRLRTMASHCLVSGLPRVFPSLPPSPAPPCTSCVASRLHADPHSSSLRLTTAPFQTLHLDVWGPAPTQGPEWERYFLVVVDNFSRHYYRILRRAGHRTVVDAAGVPTTEWIAERRIGLVMDIARTSMIHARAPHFLWPYAVCYAAHQLNLQPRVSRLEASPTSLCTEFLGVGSAFRVWGCLVLVPDTSADKLSACAVPCVFLGFSVASADWSFYHLPLHQFLDSCDVWFDESVSYYTWYPRRGLPVPPPPLFLAPSLPPALAPPVPPPPVLPRQSPQQPSALPRQVTVDSVGVGAGGAAIGGTWSGGARLRGARAGGAGTGGASSGGAGAGGDGTGGASSGGAGVGGPGTGGVRTGGARAGDPDPVGTPFGDSGSGGAIS
ncbi:unnamed protein product [Closterium sp. NIES-53]